MFNQYIDLPTSTGVILSSTSTVKDTLPSLSCASYSALLNFASPIQTGKEKVFIGYKMTQEETVNGGLLRISFRV